MVRDLRRFDFFLLLACLALVGYGLALIYSGSLARYGSGHAAFTHVVVKQALFAAFGLLLMLLVTQLDYRAWNTLAPALYAVSVLALMAVLVIGHKEFGSRRWFPTPVLQLQPSELAKLVTIVFLAKYLSDDRRRVRTAQGFLITLALAAVPAGLVFLEPDLGTAVVFIAVWLGMIYVAGARMKHLLTFLGACVASIPFVVLIGLSGYQKDRFQSFIDPAKDPLGAGFNILQSEISIGSGGWWGKGFTHGPQTQLAYLRTQTTDYVFSVLGEELGFVGAMVLFFLFIVLLFRGLRTASRSPDDFGRYIATGIVIMIVVQTFINIGVNVRLFPVTGIPLPFISQGGSSLLTMFVAVGILQSIAVRRRATPFRSS
ncbi:MAG TPA: rod shape-determining protein RodA [Dehalococcoidia bacterium]|nr:rod shape-determining protein RodA [Dehalococcoidia bacterium]